MIEDKTGSPARRSISSQISAMGTKLSRALSKDGRQEQAYDKIADNLSNLNTRSVSRGREYLSSGRDERSSSVSRDAPRGREALISTGRGGAGNIVRSPSRDIEPESRGHINSANIAAKALSSGRGGAGNIRSASREPGPETSSILSDKANATAEYEREILQRHADAREEVPLSTGRGGFGNISASRSRSRSTGPALHSSGRGGAGNIQHGLGNPEQTEILEEQERLKHAHPDGIHSTGRGGLANVTSTHVPGVEKVQHLEPPIFSSGRGGAGNIRSRSVSREPVSRDPSKERHVIGHLWNKVTHPHPPHTPDPDAIQEAPGKEEE